MKTIIITGPSGSGKSYLVKKLIQLLDNSIVIKTDSYYKDSLFIKFLSIFINDIYDRTISFKRKEIMNTLVSIYNKEKIVLNYYYDFMTKKSIKSKIKLNYNCNNQFVIIEGIFSHRLDLNYKETVNIECNEKKINCYNRRLKRDKIERGRNVKEVQKRFSKSWYLFYKNIKEFKNSHQVVTLKPSENISDEKVINILNKS